MKQLALVAIAFGLMLLSGCVSTVRIGKVLADPVHYQNRDVHLAGTVTGAIDIKIAGAYWLDDGTGRITVLATSGAPKRGSRLEVVGRVQNGVSVMGHTVLLAVQEQKRRYAAAPKP